MLYPVILLSFFIPLALILMLRVNIVVEYVRNDVDDNISLSFFALNKILKYKFEVPLIDVGSEGVKFQLVRERGKKDTVTGEKSKKTGMVEFIQRTLHIRMLLIGGDKSIRKIRCYIKKTVTFDRFELDVVEGTGDAGSTGLVNGFLWIASGLLVSFASNIFRIKSKEFDSRIEIKADYNKEIFKVDLFGIFHTKLVHIIVILASILLKRIRGKKNFNKETGGGISG